MEDQLTKIDRKDLELLKKLYSPENGSKSDLAYMTIDNFIRCFQSDPDVEHMNFYCLNGDFSHGTFVVVDRNTCYADTLDVSTGELHRLLMLLDFSKGYFFLNLPDDVASVLRDVIKSRNIEIFFDGPNGIYYLPKETARDLIVEVPDDIELRPITKLADIEKAFSVWPHRAPNTARFFERAAKYNPSMGAFLKDGTLVAWVFRFMTGPLLALQTDENHFGHGYAALVVKAISKQVAELGHDVCAGIFDPNTPSKNLFGKLGFKQVKRINWITTKHSWYGDEGDRIDIN